MDQINLNTIEKRKLSILKKQLNKIQQKINFLEKHGELKVKSIVEKRQETIQQKKTGLPNYISDDKPTQKSRNERINIDHLINQKNKTENKERTELLKTDHRKFKKYITSALNNAVKEITIVNDEFSIISLMQPEMNKDEAKSIDDARRLLQIINLINKDLLISSINYEILKSFYSTDNKTYNILTNIVIKYQMYKMEYDKVKDKMITNFENYYYNSKLMTNLKSKNQINEWVTNEVNLFITQLQESQGKSSSLRFNEINYIKIQQMKAKKTKAGSYIPTPPVLALKRAIVNIKNDDNKCILWALSSYLRRNIVEKCKDKNEKYHYKKYLDDIKLPENIKFPIDIETDIKKIEKLNNLKINVFYYEEKDTEFKSIQTLYNNNDKTYDNICNLLLLTDNEGNEHITWIKSLDKLLRKNLNDEKRLWCHMCLASSYDSEDKLKEHLKLCSKHEAVAVKMPKLFNSEEDKFHKDKIKFKNFQNNFKHPVAVYLDFESTLKKVDVKDNLTVIQELKHELFSEEESTKAYQKHIANSCGLKFNCIHGKYSEELKIINNADENIVLEETVKELERLAQVSYNLFQKNKQVKQLTESEQKLHTNTICCFECKINFSKENKKVIHHDHITGDYISSICNTCNLQFKLKPFLPIYIHNLKGYDSHFLIPALAKYGYQETENELISAIPCNEEKYISFSKKIKVDEKKGSDFKPTNKQKWHIDNKTEIGLKILEKTKDKNVYFELRFLDSIAFMPASLSSLIDNLNPKNDEIQDKTNKFEKLLDEVDDDKKLDLINEFHENIKLINLNQITDLRRIYKNTSLKFYNNDEQFLMMVTKGIYPYDYIDSYEKLNETELPPIDCFYSDLTNEECSLTDYTKAKNMFNNFKCKTLLEYHNYYLSADVLLLADVFESFKNVCYKIYKLDVSYYYTAPSLSWDAFLKLKHDETNGEFEIDLLTCIDMYEFYESGTRGGLSQISKRYAKANNKYMSNYKPAIDKTTKKETNALDEYILYLDANNLYGHGMSAFLPKCNFKWNNDVWTTETILSLDDQGKKGYTFSVDIKYKKKLHDLHNGYALAPESQSIKASMLNDWQQKDYTESKIEKLITSFDEKTDYVINYRLLKLYIKLGLKIKVKKCLEYEQEDYMKSYIMKNTTERTKAKNEFEKLFYKLMNNSVYGKTLENVRNRIKFRLISSEEKCLSIRNKRIKYTIFNENLIGVHLCKQQVVLNKPIFIGQTVLDESKLLMYDFHYNTMLKNFDRENIDLLFTDTDSLCYHIKKQDPFEFMKNNKNLFDLSDYPKDHELYDPLNKKVIGKFKNESITQITEFVGLRSKLYSYKTDNGKESKKCKGVKTCVVNKDIIFDNYKCCLFNSQNVSVSQNTFRSYKHQVYTETVHKTALSFADDKTYICDNLVNCRTIGHYKNIKI